MPVPTDYISGTITLTNGSTSFSGTGTGWLAADFREGDLIIWVEGGEDFSSPIIQEILTNTTGTLVSEWAGPTLTDVPYRMRYQWDSSRVSAQSRQLIEQLGNGNITSFSGLEGPGVPVFNGPHSLIIKPEQDFINGISYNVQVDTLTDRDAYDGQTEGFSVLVSNVGDGRAALYSKASNASGDWTDPAYITGPTGASPVIEATVTSLPTGSTPNVNVNPITGGYTLGFELPDAEGFYWASEYDVGETYPLSSVVRYNRSSFIAIQNVPINEPPSNAFPPVDNSFWEVLAQGGMNGTGTITELIQGDGIAIDSTDPTQPVVSLDAAFSDLKDVDFTTNPPENGNVPIWDTGQGKFIPGAAGSSGTTQRGHLFGLTLSNNASDATNDIDISAGAAASDEANPALMSLTTSLTKRLDAAWAVGSGNGGLDTGSIANTSYHLWLIQRSDTEVVDVLFSASSTAPTMPANYDRKRRIGSVIRSGGAILGFVQDGDDFTLNAPVTGFTDTNPGTSALTRALAGIPTGVRVKARGTLYLNTNSTSFVATVKISDLAVADTAPSASANHTAIIQTLATSGNYRISTAFAEFTNTAAQVRVRASASDANFVVTGAVYGWSDPRGRV